MVIGFYTLDAFAVLHRTSYGKLDANMEKMELGSHTRANGILQIQTATDLKDRSVEGVVVIDSSPNAQVAILEAAEPQYNP